MQLLTANLWDCQGSLCITTNGFVKQNGLAVMGAGVAKQAVQRIPGIQAELGRRIRKHGNSVVRIAGPDHHVKFDRNVLAFPVKHNWWEQADLELIAKSAEQLAHIIDFYIADDCYLPKPGCGNGGLDWSDVEPVLDEWLWECSNLYIIDR